MSSITVENGTLVYQTPYNPALVAALKTAVPASDRQWDKARKAWIIAPTHADTLSRLTEQYLGERIQAPTIRAAVSATETRILDVRYLGATKDRGDGQPNAFAYVGGSWSAIFPESVLREWFNAEQRPDELPTLYAVLGIKQDAADADVRTAYRRLARTWHPDVCREPDAKEQFQKIQHAYDVLRVPAMKAKYDAGLALAASLNSQQQYEQRTYNVASGYRSPLRCGLIMAEGREVLGRFVVERIQLWQDIVRGDGRILVTSWPMGAVVPVESWV